MDALALRPEQRQHLGRLRRGSRPAGASAGPASGRRAQPRRQRRGALPHL